MWFQTLKIKFTTKGKKSKWKENKTGKNKLTTTKPIYSILEGA